MANLKETFAKGLTTLNVKTNNFMEESKCKTYISTLEGEIKEIKIQIGNLTYEKWSMGESVGEEVELLLQKIKEKYAEIDVQKEKIARLSVEEKQILGTGSTPQSQEASAIFCSQCGTQNAANYKFCCKCGAPLK